jgi:hypothetical protein
MPEPVLATAQALLAMLQPVWAMPQPLLVASRGFATRTGRAATALLILAARVVPAGETRRAAPLTQV